MKKWYRGNFTKTVLIFLEHFLFTAAVLCLLLVILMKEVGVNLLEGSKSFGSSYTLAENLYYGSFDILTAQAAMENNLLNFPEDGGSGRMVDLMEVREGKSLTWKNTSGVAYSWEELLDWSSSIDYIDEEIVNCRTEDGKSLCYFLDDFQNRVSEGEFIISRDRGWQELYDAWSDGRSPADETELLFEILNAWDEEWTAITLYDKEGRRFSIEDVFWEAGVPDRRLSPEGADSLPEAVNASEVWRGRLSEAYVVLEQALAWADSVNHYKLHMANYQEGNTNITYLFVNLDKEKVYSNNSEYVDFDKYPEALEEMTRDGWYAVIYPIPAECYANINTERYSLERWNTMVDDACGCADYVYAVKVGEELAVSDSLALSRVWFDRLSGRGPMVLTALLLLTALFLIVLVWLSLIAGRRTNDEEVHLCWFDRWYTEIAALTVFALAGCVAAAVFGFIDSESAVGSNWEELVFFVAVISSLSGVSLFLTGYLSLVRRIKGKTLWRGSLCRLALMLTGRLLGKVWSLAKRFFRLMGTGMGLLMDNLRLTVKVMLSFGAFVLAGFVITGFTFEDNAGFLILLVLLDGMAALYMLGKAYGGESILKGLEKITGGELQYKIPTERLRGSQRTMAEYINRIGDGLDAAVEESVRSERMKTELITNVSHDIKTPLTSIINYVDLLKRENFTDPKICGYLDILEAKAQRLKILTEDVVEASKASSGSITLDMKELNFSELVQQVAGEFQEKFQARRLTLVMRIDQEAIVIRADGQRLWRVLENIFNNVEKYALEGTRVYAEASKTEASMEFSLKNISSQQLNISPDELTERFIRGDVSRNTEGSGLGLSIARSLTELQGGSFRLYVDGDLFKVVITFALVKEQERKTTEGRS